MATRKICALIPSYNEARTIGGIVRELKVMGIDALVVDDGSIDETGSIAATAGATVIKHDKNKGKGASLREGFRYILDGDFTAALVMDGDGQHRASDAVYFLKALEEDAADIVIGNRMADTKHMPLVRVLTNRFMSGIISAMTGQKIPDTQCGFRLIKREVLDRVNLDSSHYDTESEILIKAAAAGFRIKSIPIKTVYEGEKSRINPVVDTLRFMALILRSVFASRGKAPR